MDLTRIAAATPDAALLLFADYGAGKTTVLERIKAEAARAYLRDHNQPIPILFYLKEFSEGSGLDTFIDETTRREFMASIPTVVFWDFVKQRRFLFLLDGFDEITLRADRDRRQQLLSELAPLLFGGSPAILSSRPSYFVTHQEYEEALLNTRTAGGYFPPERTGTPAQIRLSAFTAGLRGRYSSANQKSEIDPRYIAYSLNLLTDEQVNEYLAKFDEDLRERHTTAVDLRTFLDKIYDLNDLIRRPIILDMVAFTVLEGNLDVVNQANMFGPSDLYEAYTDVKLSHDWDKASSRQSFLSLEVRQQFAERCAAWMLNARVLEVPAAELTPMARLAQSRSLAATLDEVMTDLRTCSFLTISHEGSLRFVHRSFQEFFAARAIRNSKSLVNDPPLRESLPREVLYFLGGFAFSDNDFFMELVETSRAESQRAGTTEADYNIRSNLATAVLYSRERLRQLRWVSLSIENVWRKQFEVNSSAYRDVAFKGLRSEACTFSDVTFAEVLVSGDAVRNLQLRDCKGNLGLEGSVDSVTVTGGDIELSDASSTTQISVESGKALLRLASPEKEKLVSIQDSECELRGGQYYIDAQLSALRITASNMVTMDLKQCDISTDSQSFAHLRGEVDSSSISLRDAGGDVTRSRQAPLRIGKSLILCDRGLQFSAKEITMTSGLVFGGSIDSGRAAGAWQGVLLRQSHDKRLDGVKVVLHGRGIVIEGGGQPFERLADEMAERVRLARQGSANAIAALTDPVRTLVQGLESDNRPQIDEALDLTDALIREYLEATTPRRASSY